MELDPKLDNRFTWRWLLPIVRGDQVLLLGFAEHELAFWKQALMDAAVTEDSAKATLWLGNDLPSGRSGNLDFWIFRTTNGVMS